jgi:uncharacterized membrane-anchored protein YitT (DUF2179 family)
MKEIIVPLIAGLLGTLAMSSLLLLPSSLGFARVDIIRAVGAFITKDRETAFKPGLAIHFAAGVLFAYIYFWAFRFMNLPLHALSGMFTGAIHGAVVMLYVSIAVLEHHPLKRYQERGPMTGISQLLGHIIYGLVVGAVVQFMYWQ